MPRSPMSPARRRALTIGAIVGIFGGVPLLALAATLFVFGSFSGSTSFADTAASARILAVQPNLGGPVSSVNCSNAKRVNDTTFTVNPVVKRNLVQGQDPQVVPGACSFTLRIRNTGGVAIIPALDKVVAPTGWTVTLGTPVPSIAAGATGSVKVTIAAAANATVGSIGADLVATDNGTPGTATVTPTATATATETP